MKSTFISYSRVFPCRPQMQQMATAMIFIEVPEWTWHYNPALDSLILVARSCFKLYIFFCHPFSVLVVSWHVDPRHPYVDFLLCLTHPSYFPKPAFSASSMETNPSEGSSPTMVLHVMCTLAHEYNNRKRMCWTIFATRILALIIVSRCLISIHSLPIILCREDLV